MLLPMLTSIKQ